MGNNTINKVFRYMVLALSLFAMFLVIGATIFTIAGKFNPSPDGDEGSLARLFQIAIVLLLPTGAVFLVTSDWHQPKKVLKNLILPAVALVVAFALLYYMEHVY